jgi:hypothetical protein
MAGVRDWAVTMKGLSDAALLHNTRVALPETAALQPDEFARRQVRTFVIAGGGFAGVETTGAVNDLIRETARLYPSIAETDIRVVPIHPDSFLLPELGVELGLYAERKLRERGVDIVKGVRVVGYDGSISRWLTARRSRRRLSSGQQASKPVRSSHHCHAKKNGAAFASANTLLFPVSAACGPLVIAPQSGTSRRARRVRRRHSTVCGKA